MFNQPKTISPETGTYTSRFPKDPICGIILSTNILYKRDMSTASWAGLDTVTLTYIAPPSQQSSRTSEDYEDTLRVP